MKLTNPVIAGFHPDPSVCRVGEDYYLVTSTFEYFPGVPVFHSRDLVHWRQISHCLTRASQLPMPVAPSSGGVYAPTIRHHGGRFYMVTTNVSQYVKEEDSAKGRHMYVWTDDPAGEWSEPIHVDQGGIDPSLLFDDDGTVYFTTSQSMQSVIDIETGRRLTDIRQTWPGTGGAYPEAPHLYKINGLYYLMLAEGGTGRGHMVTIARSDNPWEGFEPCPHNPILSNRALAANTIQATGHADLVQAHDGSWWLVFLAIREVPGLFPRTHHLGRETFLAPVDWVDGWPVVNRTGTMDLDTDAPLLPAHEWEPEPVRDDFDEPKLRLCWNFLRNPNDADWSLSERPGSLTLRGSAVTLNDPASPAFVARRQQHWDFRAATVLDFSPADENEEAGMTVLMNERHHYELAVTRCCGERCVTVRRRIGSLEAVVFEEVIADGPVRFEITADPLIYRFACAVGEGDLGVVAAGETRHIATEVAGGFTGAYVGLYATGHGQPCSGPAHFDWFDYEPTA